MDAPICVTDAVTLVDHIHKIKAWVYNGHLRLVLPSSTSESLEQLYQKSIEPKPAPKEQPRPRSSAGRSTRKEYPAFDINPRIARDYVLRLKAGKDQQTGQLGRPIYEEEESHAGVSFQQANEHYTAWKGGGAADEEEESLEERPTTWAEALRKKQNLANGVSEKIHSFKGPIKPKLVAKAAGSELSPWKIQKNAPSISAKEVPGVLRPFMSCALWRIHESIDRNDSNQLFVLTDQQRIRDVAQSLNIQVRSAQDLAEYITSRVEPRNLDLIGDLERDFGTELAQKAVTVNGFDTKAENQRKKEEIARVEAKVRGDEDQRTSAEEGKGEQETFAEGVSTESLKIPGGLALEVRSAGKGAISEKAHTVPADMGEVKSSPTDSVDEKTLREDEGLLNPAASLIEDNVSDQSVASAQPVKNPWNKTAPKHLVELPHVSDPTPREAASTPRRSSVKSPVGSDKDFNEKQSLVPVSNLAGQRAKPFDFTATSAVVEQPANKTIPSPKEAEAKAEDKIKEGSELEDSEEEVVVFKPKRSSAQGKPGLQTSRPSTANTERQAARPEQTTRPLEAASQLPSEPASYKRVSSGASHAHPAPSSGPPVIDPDAFGRGFAVNTNPNPRGGMRARHSPRPSVQNAQANHSRRSSSHQQPRLSPSRLSPHASPYPEHRVVEQPQEQLTFSQPIQAPTGSHYTPPNIPEPRKEYLPMNGQPLQPPIGTPRQTAKAPQQEPDFVRNPRPVPHQDPDFVRNPRALPAPRRNTPPHPRAKDPEFDRSVQSTPRSAPLPTFANGGGAVNPRAAAPRMPKASLFEPMLDHTRAPTPPEPRTNVPDVQYVLKSGSTREATRGKGKLWVG